MNYKTLRSYGISILLLIFGSSYIYTLPVNYEAIADKITDVTARRLEKDHRLHLIGTGGSMMDDIKMMAMSFSIYSEIDVSTARKLLIKCADEYLKAINASEQVRPYLHNYPFTIKNIEIFLCIYKPDRSDVSINNICSASIVNGVLKYRMNDPKDKFKWITLPEESYEQAVNALSQ